MDLVLNNTTTLSSTAPPRLEDIINKFIVTQDVKQNSKELYRRTLKQYFKWVEKNNYNLSDVTREEIIQYKADLLEAGMSSLSVGSYITSVRKFYEWTEANKFYPNVAKGIKTPKRKQQFKKQPLSTDQAKELLNYYEDKAKRDYAIITLLLKTGLRTIEIARANVEDIVFKGTQRVLLIHGKGRDEKDDFVILTDRTYKPIKDYLSSRDNVKNTEPLFTSTSNNSKGDTLTTRTISKIAKEGLKAIGLNERSFTAHSLRHTTAVNILRAGGSIETAQHTLRHTSPATTQIYTATIKEELRLKDSGEALIDSLY
jgi:integrase/recombinase XerC/integrase/recombinase XerD